MYTPQNFEIIDKKEIFGFINENSFGQLVSMVEGRLFSSHVPFLLGDDGLSLFCHIARKNPQWKEIENQEVLVTFQGAHDYVSPSWYTSPGVPTWNYQVAHVYGQAELITEPEALGVMVRDLTAYYEASFDKPWLPVFDESMSKAIIGIKITINELQCKYKLSQNRPADDQERVKEQLKKRGSVQLARAMKLE